MNNSNITLAERWENLNHRIRSAEAKYHREQNSVSLLAVSKGQPITAIQSLYEIGQKAFGENYLQEALEKMSVLSSHKIEWHFIGAIQSRKIVEMANHFDWIHTVSRWKDAQLLAKHRHANSPLLNICLQVKLDDTPNKPGIFPNELYELACSVSRLSNLTLRGLMTVPPYTSTFSEQKHYFEILKNLLGELNAQGFTLDTLSMGMSQDFEAAIAEGATIIRIGTELFGARK